MTELKSRLDRLDIKLLIRYVVGEAHITKALAVVEKYRRDPIVQKLLRSYYQALPEAREEPVVDIRVAAHKQGTYLFVVKTTNYDYLYLGSAEEALYIGEFAQGVEDELIVHFFGFKNGREFRDHLPKRFADLQPVPASGWQTGKSRCLVCGTIEGDLHILGCPVELCPWCSGMLSRCNCRFDQLGVDCIDDEKLLDRFEELLERKGRITFLGEQNPSYPTAGNDAPFGELKGGQDDKEMA